MSDQLLDGPDKAVDEEDSDEVSEPEVVDKPSNNYFYTSTPGPVVNRGPQVNNYVQVDDESEAHDEPEIEEPLTDYSLQYQESEDAEVNESNTEHFLEHEEEEVVGSYGLNVYNFLINYSISPYFKNNNFFSSKNILYRRHTSYF